MRMWRTDGRAAYLLLMLLTGLRSAGVREPRRLYPPSPPPRIAHNLGFDATPRPAPSLLITLTAWICCVPPRPHPHRLSKPAGFWFSSSSTLLPSITLLNILYVFAPPSLLHCCFLIICKFVTLSRGVISCKNIKRKQHSIRTRLSQVRCAGRRGEHRRQRGRSAAGASLCSAGSCTVEAQWKQWTKQNLKKLHPLSPLSPVTAKTCSPSPAGKTETKTRLRSPTASVSQPTPSCLSSPGSSLRSALDRPLLDFSAGRGSCWPGRLFCQTPLHWRSSTTSLDS